MKTAVVTALTTGLLAFAAPFKRQDASGYTDTQILQYALTLENLEKEL